MTNWLTALFVCRKKKKQPRESAQPKLDASLPAGDSGTQTKSFQQSIHADLPSFQVSPQLLGSFNSDNSSFLHANEVPDILEPLVSDGTYKNFFFPPKAPAANRANPFVVASNKVRLAPVAPPTRVFSRNKL